MRFGLVPLDQALGAVLAHSVRLPHGKLRKGLVLGAAEIDALRGVGMAEVTVARPDPDDLDENTAAATLAQALAGTSVTQSAAFTGRVNLLAADSGTALIDADAIHALNRIDPMITCATVPPHQQMTTGGMIATIKIIAYAVPKPHIDAACAVASGAIGLAPVTLTSATLIVTEVPGGPGLAGQDAIAARLTALGITLDQTITCAHTADAIAAAITAIASDLVLILTGSATSDTHDVAPEGVRNAGGQVIHFGMPVDPGNLLFIGEIGARPVIGLPGCARSPALNGADWVLARVAAGIPVTSDDIAGMGVGGLLKEIPTRPQPRHRPPAQ